MTLASTAAQSPRCFHTGGKDNSFTEADADVACRQLFGTRSELRYPTAFTSTDGGAGPIWMRSLRCSSTEQALSLCLFDEDTTACSHADDVGLKCEMCPAGSRPVAEGFKSSSKQCEAGKRSNAQRTACVECDAGYYSSAGTSRCTKCERGKFSTGGASTCTNCGDGDWAQGHWEDSYDPVTNRDQCRCAPGYTGASLCPESRERRSFSLQRAALTRRP